MKPTIFLREYFEYFVVIIFFIIRLGNTRTGLHDLYEFRQTQTAFGIRDVASNGFNLLHLHIPILGKPYEVPFEFPLFQNLAGGISHYSGIAPSTAGRLLSLISYCGTLFIIIFILRKRNLKWFLTAALMLATLSPFALEWSDACLIDNFVIFLVFLSALFYRQYLISTKKYLYFFSAAIACLSAAVKITSVFPTAFFILAYLLFESRSKISHRKIYEIAILLCATMITGVVWTTFADSIKKRSIWTSWLTSAHLTHWNFGTLNQRLNLMNWVMIGGRYWLMGGLCLIWLVIASIYFLKRRDPLVFLLVGLLLSPAIYFNLFLIHDYYFLAIFPLFIFVLPLSIALLSEIAGRVIGGAFAFSIVLSLVLSWTIPLPKHDYVNLLRQDRGNINVLESNIMKFTPKNDVILLAGCDWDPSIFYHSSRMGLALPNWVGSTQYGLELVDVHGGLSAFPFLAVCGPYKDPVQFNSYSFVKLSDGLFKIVRH